MTLHEDTRRPAALPVIVENVPDELKARPQWVLWRLDWVEEPGGAAGWRKVPYRVNGRGKAQTNSPKSWGTFDDAVRTYRSGGWDGVGYVFSESDPYSGVDLDDCRDEATGAVSGRAMAIVERLATYTEVSPSGTGLKTVLLGKKPFERCGFQIGEPDLGKVEVYDRVRFWAMTGHVLPGRGRITEASDRLRDLHGNGAFSAAAGVAAESTRQESPFKRQAVNSHEGNGKGRPSAEDRCIAYLAKCDPAVSGQGGHGDTYWPARAACWGFDLGYEVGFQILWSHFNPRCSPPWTEKELRHKCEDADTKPFGKPRGWLLNEDRPREKDGDTASPGAPSPPADAGARTGAAIILDFYRQRYRPDFRRGNVIHCADGCEVFVNEATVPTSGLINLLATATDAPRNKDGVCRNALPGFFNKWAKVAWGDLLSELPDEDTAELGSDSSAGEEFYRLVRDAMLSQVTFAQPVKPGTPPQQERRSLIGWCKRFAREGPWRDVRSLHCWTRERLEADGRLVLQVAVRQGLFAQLRADGRLVAMGVNKFGRRAERYGVGRSSRDERPHGQSAVVLADAFVADLLATLPDDGGAEGDGRMVL